MTEIWQLSRRGATGELKAEFKFQRGSCKLSFLLPPPRQSAPESLLAGYVIANLFHSDYFVACHNRCWWSILQNHIRSFDGNTATRQSHKTSWLVTWKSCLYHKVSHSKKVLHDQFSKISFFKTQKSSLPEIIQCMIYAMYSLNINHLPLEFPTPSKDIH